MQNKNCAFMEISANQLQWEIERLVWIAFYHNEKNEKCFISTLPKDIIKNYILNFLRIDPQTIRDRKGKIVFGKVAYFGIR